MKNLPTIDELNAELEQPEKLPTIDELNAQLKQPEKLPTIDELNAGLEQQNQLPTIDELNAELGQPTKLPTIEELNAEIEQPTKPPTQEQQTAAQENPAAEPEKKPVVGLNEMAGLSYEAQTGVDAPKNAVGKHIVNVFGFAGKNLANAQMNAAQTLVDGSERSDDDTNRALSRMLYGDIGGTVASWFSVPDVLEEWDAGEGQRYTDKGERTKARNAFAAGIAKQFIADRTRTQQDAQKELQTREKTFGAETMSDLENTAGYMVPFAMGPLGIAAQFLTGAIGNAEGLANDEYGFDDDGNLIVTAKGDDASTAAAKGIMSSAIETGAEIIGGNLNVQQIKEASVSAALNDGLMVLHGDIEGRRRLSGKAEQRIAVGAVVGDLKFDHMIVQPHFFTVPNLNPKDHTFFSETAAFSVIKKRGWS